MWGPHHLGNEDGLFAGAAEFNGAGTLVSHKNRLRVDGASKGHHRGGGR